MYISILFTSLIFPSKLIYWTSATNHVSSSNDWKIREQVGTIVEDTPMPNHMPLPTKIISSHGNSKSFLYKYSVKKIELLEVDKGKNLLQKKIQYITVDPFEAKYFILLNSPEQTYPLPLRNVLDVKVISTNTVEFDFFL
jgi:hypothetical protein